MEGPREPEPNKKSTFSHFMLEAEGVINSKEKFKEILMNADFELDYDRQQSIKYARNMLNDEVFMLFSNANNRRITDQIAMMESFDRDLLLLLGNKGNSRLLVAQKVMLFKDAADSFLRAFSQAQHEAKLGLQTIKERSEIDKFFAILDTSKIFQNSFGIDISPEMLLLALGLSLRTIKKWDNVIMIDAMPGTGKTTFDFALQTTMMDIYALFLNIRVKTSQSKMRYSQGNNAFLENWIRENVFVTETREYCNKIVTTAENFSLFMFIEAGNQFSNKRFYDEEQQDLVNTVERIRFHGLTMGLEWNTVEGLDKTVRDRRATIVISQEERGKAIVRGFNRNPGGRGLTKNPRTKNNVAITAEDANNILVADALQVLQVPYYTLPKKWEAMLDARKEEGSRYINKKRRMERYYAEFLNTVPENTVRITSELLKKYSVSTHQVLSMRKLAIMIAENIGLGKTTRLFANTDLADANIGYIELDDVMRSYIAHVKADMAGYVQYEKEKEDSKAEDEDIDAELDVE